MVYMADGIAHMADGTMHMADGMMHMTDGTMHMTSGVTVLAPLLPLQPRLLLRIPRLRLCLLFPFPYLLLFPCLSSSPSSPPPCLNVNGFWPPIFSFKFPPIEKGYPHQKIYRGFFWHEIF